MIVEDKKFVNVVHQEINSVTDETIFLLKKLVKMLETKSFTTTFGSINYRIEATGSALMDGIGTVTNYGAATLPIITSISQLSGNGISFSQFPISIIEVVPFDGGVNYTINDLVTLSGNGIVKILDVYDRNITNINNIPISGGTGYVGGEIITLSGGLNGKVIVTNVDNSNVVLEVSLLESGYYFNTGHTEQISSTGSGTGLIVDIISIGSNVGVAKSIMLISGGTNYTIGNYNQISTTGIGSGLIVSVANVDNGYGNNNFLQMEESRWLYTEMIRNNIQF